MALVPGSNAGPYRIVEPLGRGGMASVYRAYEPKLDRYVALKVLPREFLHDPGFAERFHREAKALATLEHPNIVPIYNYDIDEADGIPWMAMRLISGGSLAELLKRGRLPLARSVAILRGVADALDYAHAHPQKIVHRDVKPQNVLLDEGGRVYLADFGIAKMLEASGGLTATGMITGTPQYMAPEQATGTKIGPAADIYALGIVAYEMLTGRVPFSADTPVAVMMKHVQEPLPLPPPDRVPEPLLRAILKCTAKKPEDRWPSAGAFVSALEAGLTAPQETVAIPRTAAPTRVPAPTLVSPPTAPDGAATRPAATRPPARVARPAGRFLGLGVAGLLALAGVVAAGLWLLRSRSPEASGPPAVAQTSAPAPTAAATVTPPPAPATRPSASSARGESAPVMREAPLPTPRAGASPTPAPKPIAVPPTPPPSPTPTPVPEAVRAVEPAAPAVDPELERLVAGLTDPDTVTRRRAAQDLAARGPGAAPALAALTGALGDRSPDVRLRAAEALGRIGPVGRSAVPGLVQALRDTDPMVRAEAAKSLGLMAEAAAPAVGPLAEALASPDVAVRREAAKALARVGRGAEPALRALIAALDDKDKTVRAQAARALGRIGPAAREAIPRLTAMSRDPDVLVSREAQTALESISP